MVYTLFEKIITFTTILTIGILSLHAFGIYNLEIINTIDDLAGLTNLSSYPVVGLVVIGAILILGGIFIAAAIGGDGRIGNVSNDRSNMQSVIIGYAALWGLIITLIIIG